MPEVTMTLDQFIKKARTGKIFTVGFIKRGDGEPRKMLCRCGVYKHVSGVGARYDALSKNLLRVWDLEKTGYRQINLDWLIWTRMAGQVWNWNEDKKIFILYTDL